MEIWKPIAQFEGLYEVSSLGRVRSLNRKVIGKNGISQNRKGKLLRQSTSHNGYKRVSLRNLDVKKDFKVHRLVLEAFVGPCPSGMQGCHNDGDQANNHVDNLRWGTRSENEYDKVGHGTHNSASKVTCKRGHPLKDPNLTNSGKKLGYRICRACNRATSKRVSLKNISGLIISEAELKKYADMYYSEIMS